MSKCIYELGDIVRIKAYHEDHINAYGRVNSKPGDHPEGKVWVVNMNMPFSGTISEFFDPEELEISEHRRT